MRPRCLYFYEELPEDRVDFHVACSKKIFGQPEPPKLPYDEEQLEEQAKEVIRSRATVTGVQAKLSLHIAKSGNGDGTRRFTIVGLWGGYILKPPTPNYPQLPAVEDLTMHLASIAKIKVVPHSLIRLRSGNLAYITKRIDRTRSGKVPMEDMCQLTERLTEHKYQGSYEQVAKAIVKYSKTPGLDVVNFFELVLFSYLTGNADMHLKNFSLIEQQKLGMVLSPAYDLVDTALVNPADQEELALNLNGKKSRLRRLDFEAAFTTLSLDPRQQANIFSKMESARPAWIGMVRNSFLSSDLKEQYIHLLEERFEILSRPKA
jgi:serine/threonine-protein kinase HipA